MPDLIVISATMLNYSRLLGLFGSMLLALSEGNQQLLRLQDARRIERKHTAQLLSKTKAAMLKYSALNR